MEDTFDFDEQGSVQEPSAEEEKPQEKELTVQEPKMTELDLNNVAVPHYEPDKSQTFEDQAKDYIMAAASVAAVKDADTQEAVLKNKSEEFITHSEVKKKQEKVEERRTEKDLQEAQNSVHDGVASMAGITKSLPIWMQKVLYPILGTIQCLLYLVIGSIGSVCSIILDVVSMIARKFVELTDVAKKLFWTLFAITAVLLAYFILAQLLERWDIFILPWKW